MLILKFTKNQGFILSLENPFLEKPEWPWGEVSNRPPAVFLRLITLDFCFFSVKFEAN